MALHLHKQSCSGESASTPTTEAGREPGPLSGPVPMTVGIGASAGGHEALEQIFTALPCDCDLAFVVVMHLQADRPSLLTDLIRRYTSLQVLTAAEGMPLQANTVYVAPAGKDLTVRRGRLRSHGTNQDAGLHLPIDSFFTSLAEDQGKRALAVVLSGFGFDGSAGVKRVKEAGGIVLVQDPETAINPPMPQNAIDTGAADLVLPPGEIADRLVRIAQGEWPLAPGTGLIPVKDEDLQTLFAVLKTRTGHDFSSYKRNTVLRRIERRMAVTATARLSQYLDLFEDNPHEAHALCQELLIGVTSFFRDPEAFEFLRKEIIPRLFAHRETEEPLRIWHACCATGEEAYSVAMLLLEHLEKEHVQAKVQIFATDLDEKAVARARAGIYPDDITADVSAERLHRFFTRSDNCWQVTKQLREMIVFAHHNIIKDPPFSRLNLLVCRNFLIYLTPEIQRLLIPLFHQVLNPGGFLFLGSAETVGLHSNLFSPIDKRWKIFMRMGGKSRTDMLFPFSGPVRKLADIEHSVRSSEAHETETVALAERLLMERYVPARVIINEKNEVVHFSDRAGAYLVMPGGKPTRDILKMAKEELRPALRAAIYKAFTNQQEIVYRGIHVVAEGGETTINIVVVPIKEPPPAGKLALVILEPASPATVPPAPCVEVGQLNATSKDSLIRQLEEQLRVTGEQLQSTTEQLETSNERFMLTNEELMTVNEELQSTNEELQSTNEELVTVNSELQKKMEELNQSNSDMENLFASSEIATIFLDRELFIKRFSPAMATIFNLIPADIGRPFRVLNSMIDWSSLPLDAASVLDKLVPVEREVTALDGRSFIMRVLPYRTTEGVTDGIVVTLVDISERKRAEEALCQSELQYRTLFDTLIEGFCTIEMVFDPEGKPVDYRFLEINPAFEKQTGLHNAQGRLMRDLAPDHEKHWFEIYGKVALTGESVQFENEAKALGRYYDVCAYRIGEPEGRKVAILFNDITERKRAEETLRLSEQRRSLALEAAQAATWEWDLRTNENVWSNELWPLYGLEPNTCEPSYEEWLKSVHPDDQQKTVQIINEAVRQRLAFSTEWRVNTSGGPERWLMSRGQPSCDSHGEVGRYLGIVMDITERKRAEEERKALQSQLIQAQKMEAIGTLAGGIAHDFNNILGAVIGYAEMARDASPSGSAIVRDLDKVLEAGRRAADLVKQILAFSRQTNAERISLEPVHLVKEAVKLLRPALPSTIAIKQRLDASTGFIMADPTQFHQIVMNLCTNAFHAMEHTGGVLEITLGKRSLAPEDLPPQSAVHPGTFVVLSIADTGPGIAPEIREKIFYPYFTTKEVGKGTGLGLAIVHGIVAASGGFVTCESEPGKGTAFHVFFPTIESEATAATKAAATVPTGRERILFVDDEKILAEMAQAMLERLGYAVTARTSSLDALLTFQKRPDRFDAVITDQTMPGMHGTDLARRMLQIRPDIPIILCTGYSSLIDEDQARAYGIKGFAMKPLTKNGLAELLRKVLDESAAGEGGPHS